MPIRHASEAGAAKLRQAKPVLVEILPGELVDKITVLRVKLCRIADEAKLANVRVELATLEKARDEAVPASRDLRAISEELEAVNAELYDVIAGIYACEERREEESKFVALARSVYRLNDHRAVLKREINRLLGSRLFEEKGHDLGSPTHGRKEMGIALG